MCSDCETDGADVNESKVAVSEGAILSRRSLLTGGAAAAAALGSVALAAPALAQNASASRWEGRRFKAFVNADGVASVVDLELLPTGPYQVIIATEATQASYSNTQGVVKPVGGPAPGAGAPGGDRPPRPPSVVGYIGVGRVVHVGESVRRVQVGDRVVVGVTPQCGVCYNCLNGRADMCQFLEGDDVNGAGDPPFARLVSDGREVTGGRNGFTELMVATEEWLVPVFTDLPASALSLLGSVGATGLAASTSFVPVRPGTDVVVFGCGPIGLSMVNGAAIMGANRIIAVEPIKYRRDAALALGATAVVDPTGKNDTLVAELRELTLGKPNRFLAGGRGNSPFPFVANGPDYIFEATGSQIFDPSVRGIEPQPDPEGVLEIQQIFDLCPGYGTMVTTGVRWTFPQIPIPAIALTNAGKRLIQAQYGGAHLMRDIPRMVTMMERGQYKWDKIVSAEYPLADSLAALEDAAYRTKISSHVVFDPAQFAE